MGESVTATARRRARALINKTRRYGVVNRGGRGVVGLIDVGSVGNLPEPWYQRSDLLSHVLKFEPRDEREHTAHVTTVDAALWSDTATMPFHVYRGLNGQGSSLFHQNVDYVRENFAELRTQGPPDLAETWFERSSLDHTEDVRCTTLDAVLVDRTERYHVLKIDAQGAEKPILQGAKDYLAGGDCVALHLELFRIPLYVDIALRPEVEQFVGDLGFDLLKQYPPHGTFDSQNDCVYLRRGASGPVVDAIRAAYGV